MNSFAFFDVDETLINEKSMFSVLVLLEKENILNAQQIITTMQKMASNDIPRQNINIYYYECFKGISESAVKHITKNYFLSQIHNNLDFFIEPVLSLLKNLQKLGFQIVFLSGSSVLFLEEIADFLNVKYILATRQQIDKNGCFTGEIIGRPMIAQGKKRAIQNFSKKQNVDLSKCIGIGDHVSDADFLNILGLPFILEGNKALEQIAKEKRWGILRNFSQGTIQ